MSERVLVAGSRNWTDRDAIREALRELPPNTIVIHGGARGADRLADDIAQAMGLRTEVYPAYWALYGRAAGVMRTQQMLSLRPERVLCFHLDDSPGTLFTIQEATRLKVPLTVVRRRSPDAPQPLFDDE